MDSIQAFFNSIDPLPSCVSTLAESWQLEGYKATKRDVNRIPEEIEMNVRQLAAKMSSTTPFDIETHLQGYRTTPLQDPVILAPLMGDAESLWSNLQTVLNKQEKHHPLPLVFTCPLAFINGVAVQDKNGKAAVMLQEGLRFWPGSLAAAFFRVLSSEIVLKRQLVAAFRIEGYENAGVLDFDALLKLFFVDATQEGLVSSFSPDTFDPQSLDPHIVAFGSGFNAFILAHEFAHILDDHCRKRTRNWTGGYHLREFQHLRKLADEEKLASKWNGRFTSSINRINYSFFQTFEILADVFAMRSVLLKASEIKKEFVPAFLTGAYSFLWYVELTERVHRSIILGPTWVDTERYTMPTELQDFLFRKHHPCPLSRGSYIATAIPEFAPLWELVSVAFESVWSQSKGVLFAFVEQSNGSKIDEKWTRSLPMLTGSFGFDQYGTFIYS
jgi:hypothetical protein